MKVATVKRRIEKREAQAAPVPAEGDPRRGQLWDLIFDGFGDVLDWLEGRGPAPDPHRLSELLRWPYRAGVDMADVAYFDLLRSVAWLMGAQRTADQTGQAVPQDLEEAQAWLMANHDKVTGSLLHNADKWLEYAEGKQNGTIPRGKGVIGELVVIPYIAGECGPGCRWYPRGDVVENGSK